MGIDALMFVETEQKMTKEDVLSLAVDLHEALGSMVWVSRPHHHCLELVNPEKGDCWLEKVDPSKTTIRVHLGGNARYYGKGYERGTLPYYITVAEWIEQRIPDAKILYGGDSGDSVDEVFDKKYRNELWAYFCQQGHKPYHGYFSKALGDGGIQFCDFCHITMRQYGFSKTWYSAFRCDGCGYQVETKDDGKTWTEVKK